MNVKQASVLLAEDEPLLREAMGAWLGRVAGRVFCAENGAEALRILADHPIDLVISDVRMPVMGGVAFLERLSRSRTRRPAVILLTGFSDLSLREALRLGADTMLEKPVDREVMLRAMRRSLAGPGELWRRPRGTPAKTKLRASFTSLESALAGRETKKVAFGRSGFCLEPVEGLHEGPIEFALDFQDDHRHLSGQGAVRWTAPEEQRAGIEITHLDKEGRTWLLGLLKRYAPIAAIPASTEEARTQWRRAA
jgi:CheY-like chemotaxis protein